MPEQLVAPGCARQPSRDEFEGKPAADRALICRSDVAWVLYHYTFRLLGAILPLRIVYRLASPVFQLRFGRLREKITHRLAARPEAGITPDRISRTARLCIAKLAESEIDNLLLMDRRWPMRLRCEGIADIEHLDQACASGKGVILLTAHLSATRIAKRWLAKLGYPILTIRKQHEFPDSESRFHRSFIRSRHPDLMPEVMGDAVYVHQPDCALQALRRLRTGGIVNIPFDGASSRQPVASALLGAPWQYPSGYFDLIRLSGCAVIPMLCTGNGAGLRIQFYKPVEITQTGARDEFITANLPRLIQVIEGHIRQHPPDWSGWLHD